ncbi:41446_t:CDS:2, partial [Gigaspora margarita]
NQFAVNRDMSTMFQRFQDGATLLNDEKIFQAKLCIIIKDVPKQDRDGIVSEFSLRFRTMVMQEGENNFITKMYPGGLNINPWPMFNNSEWFKSLRDIKKMLDKQDAKYNNARTFLQNTKVFMAKLK